MASAAGSDEELPAAPAVAAAVALLLTGCRQARDGVMTLVYDPRKRLPWAAAVAWGAGSREVRGTDPGRVLVRLAAVVAAETGVDGE